MFSKPLFSFNGVEEKAYNNAENKVLFILEKQSTYIQHCFLNSSGQNITLNEKTECNIGPNFYLTSTVFSLQLCDSIESHWIYSANEPGIKAIVNAIFFHFSANTRNAEALEKLEISFIGGFLD